MPRSRQSSIAGTLLLAGLALGACSPTFNWREVPVADGALVAMLPCKPDRATRKLALGPETIAIDMAGCQAGGATFAVAHISAPDAGRLENWMRAWRAATRAQLGDAKIDETPAKVLRAADAPAPVRLDAVGGTAPSDGVAAARIVWFARQDASGFGLYQASMLGRPSSAEAGDTFFEGLRLP